MPQLGAKRGCSRSVCMLLPPIFSINNQLFSNLFGCGGVPRLHGFPVGQGLLVALAGIPITIVDAGLASVLATLCRFRFARWLGLGAHHVVFIFDRDCLGLYFIRQCLVSVCDRRFATAPSCLQQSLAGPLGVGGDHQLCPTILIRFRALRVAGQLADSVCEIP